MVTIKSSTGVADTGFKMSQTAITALFGAFIGLAVLTLVTTGLMVCCKAYAIRFFLHFLWIIFSLLMILTFSLAGLLFFASNIGIDMCQVVDLGLNNKTFGQSFFTGDTYSQITTCK